MTQFIQVHKKKTFLNFLMIFLCCLYLIFINYQQMLLCQKLQSKEFSQILTQKIKKYDLSLNKPASPKNFLDLRMNFIQNFQYLMQAKKELNRNLITKGKDKIRNFQGIQSEDTFGSRFEISILSSQINHLDFSQTQLSIYNLTTSLADNFYMQSDLPPLFFNFHSKFKFKIRTLTNNNNSSLFIHGNLIYNNGATVTVSLSHQDFINTALNKINIHKLRRGILSIDPKLQTLIFTAKINNVCNEQQAKQQIQAIKAELIQRKPLIICVLAVLGIPIQEENTLMKKILQVKMQLKNKITQLLAQQLGSQNQRQQQILKQQMKSYSVGSRINSQEQYDENKSKVTYFGDGTPFTLQRVYKSQIQEQYSQSTTIRGSKKSKQKSKKQAQGGYFNISECSYKITNRQQNKNKQQTKRLVLKTLKQKHKNSPNVQNNILKLQKQIAIVKEIKFKKYLIDYYCQAKQSLDYVLMQFFQHSLQDYIYYIGDSLPIQHKIKISQQIVKAVISLHHSDVIHRDIKPSNFLIDDSYSSQGVFRLKIIDFAQSFQRGNERCQPNRDGDYACSHPYSPIQCSQNKGFEKGQPKAGLAAKQIDYWSVGITIYQVFFRKLAVSFSRAFYVDIANSWQKQLLLAVNQRQKYGFMLVDDIITIICIKELKWKQNQRMRLSVVLQMLVYLEEYVKDLTRIVQQYQT